MDAQLTLGHLHHHGARGLPADAEKAFSYYSKAASAGEPSAYANLGNMYAQGVGVEQDNATAVEYFRRGAAKDHPPSQNGLGYMYMHGHGLKQDYAKALGPCPPPLSSDAPFSRCTALSRPAPLDALLSPLAASR